MPAADFFVQNYSVMSHDSSNIFSEYWHHTCVYKCIYLVLQFSNTRQISTPLVLDVLLPSGAFNLYT